MAKIPTKAEFSRMLKEIDMHPGTEHASRTKALVSAMLSTPPAPFTPTAKKKTAAKK